MKHTALALGLLGVVAALAFERDAEACGGCFQTPTQVASDITDERMLLSVSTQQTTLYDQIRYSGNPSSFAWVLPIHGTVDVGLSADVLFDSIDTLSATTITAPAQNCPGPPAECLNGAGGFAADASAAPGADDGVTVTKQENVGPYATVQLHATDSSALNNWLTENGFVIPADVTTIIDQYVAEGFDFLAMKLLPNEGVQSMRPVRVTMPGASLSLPLRMAAVGTGATVGITIWVVADGRYEPQNFPSFRIEDVDLVWDWSTNASNYTTLRAQHESDLAGRGWELESSVTLNEQLITNVILGGGRYFGGGGVSGGYTEDAGVDYLPVTTSDGSDGGAGDTTETADQARTDDIATLLAGMSGPNVRVTRMRSDISHASMNTDFVLKASTDQSELSNVRTVSNSVNLTCPIYNNCQIVGYGTPAEAAAAATSGGNSNGSGCGTAAKNVPPNDMRFALILAGMGVATIFSRSRRRRAKR